MNQRPPLEQIVFAVSDSSGVVDLGQLDPRARQLHAALESLADALKELAPDESPPNEIPSEFDVHAFLKTAEATLGAHTPPALPPNPAPSDLTDPTPSTSRRLGDYELHEVLGRGASGVVHRATHVHLLRDVAIKILDHFDQPDSIRRLRREMRAIGQVQHPHVVAALDARSIDGTTFLVMEYIDGWNLHQLLARHKRLSIADACELTRQAALGLQAIHEHHLVHRDIKPSNLMVDRRGRVRILDLGLALILSGRDSVSRLTPIGMMMGSFDFIAPEQAEDSHNVDIRADIYSLGAVLYTLLAGRTPLAVEPHAGHLEKIASLALGQITPLQKLRPEVPEDLIALVGSMMARAPAQRIAEPSVIARQLETYSTGHDLRRLTQS